MKYRRLGRTDLRVSELALGTVELGLDYGVPANGTPVRPSPAEAAYLLNRALDLGINVIDTAPAYGESESIIGRALKSRRQDYILATKVGPLSDEGLTGRRLRRWVETSISESLRALRTDIIDLLQIHSATLGVIRNGEVLAILQDVRRAGHIRFIGVTTYGKAAPLAAIEDGQYDCLQIAYNLLDRQPEERLLPLAQQQDMGVLTRSVLLKGALTHRYTYLPAELNDLKDAVQRLQTVVAQPTENLPEIAYRYVLAHTGVSTALVGTASLHELQTALTYAQHGLLSPHVLDSVRQIVVGDCAQLDPGTWSLQ